MNPGDLITSQFWAGRFETEDAFGDFVSENDSYYAEENEDREDIFLSEFARSQQERSFDHDFFETGFAGGSAPAAVRFSDYSWAGKWGQSFDTRATALGIADYNAFLMLGLDTRPDGTAYRQIRQPRSVGGPGWRLVYLGEISHPR